MPSLSDLKREGLLAPQQRPWPRIIVDEVLWSGAATSVAERRMTLLALWGEAGAVHMALLEQATAEVAVISLNCPSGRFPSVGAQHPPALRLERSLHDLFGLEPVGSPDSRPWLDHGQWGVTAPLGANTPSTPQPPYPFLPVDGAGLHQVAVGPVHAGIIEPGHFRFTASGETVVRLEQRLGYVHKGIEGLMSGASLQQGVKLAGRVSGDSTVAYSYAFSLAAEAALELAVPPRAVWLRALLAELERLANHLGDIGAICNDAAFALMLAHCGVLRENVLRAAAIAFGHRLMRDLIVPGGVRRDLGADGRKAIEAALVSIRQQLPALVELYDETASLQDRTVGTGVVSAELVAQYGAGGFVGRGSGRAFDARRQLCYPPYDQLRFEVPVLTEGDVNARVWVRIREVEQSMALIDQLLDNLPAGELLAPLPAIAADGEGIAVVEGFRGDILVWLRLAAGAIARCHLRDPSWFQWPLLEAAIEGNIVADFPLCNKSFNCSYSGPDL